MDIFEQIVNINELVEELVKRELLIFKKYQLDVKDIKCHFQWWQKHETMFSTIGFLACHVFGVAGSQIIIERISSLVGILINPRRCHLQIENLKNLIFVNKNWFNDLRVGYKSPSNLVEFFERDINLEE